MPNLPVALIVATHPQQCRALVRAFDRLAVRSALAFTVEEACRTLESENPTVVVTVAALSDGTYQDVLRQAKRRNLPAVLMVRPEESSAYSSAPGSGVAGLLKFPFSHSEIEGLLRRVCGRLIRGEEKASA